MIQNKNIKNLAGQRFGRLVAIGLDDKPGRKKYWVCQCDCGNVKSVRSDSLQSGAIRSCGCLKKERDKINLAVNPSKSKCAERGYKSGGTRLYTIWQNLKQRCYNEHDASYSNYGGRGITVCEEWRYDFPAFHDWALANGYRDDLTIDRIDNDSSYSPENCRWTTVTEQCRNRRSNIKIKIGNSTKTLVEWCEIFDLDYQLVNARYHQSNGIISIDELFNGNLGMNQG